MSAHTNGNDEAAELRALMLACDDPNVSPRALAQADDEARREPFYDRRKVIDMARRRTRAAKNSGPRVGVADALKARRSEGEMLLLTRTREIVKELEPWIRNRRTVLFGHAEPPFHSLDEAAIWIDGHPMTAPTAEEEATVDAVLDEVDMLFEGRLSEAAPWSTWTYEEQSNLLDYWKPDGFPGRRVVRRTETALYAVYHAAARIAALTTLPPATAVAWILIGIKPGQRVRLRDGRRVTMPGLRLVTWRQRRLVPTSAFDPPLTVARRLTLDLDVRDLTDRNLRIALREATTRLERAPVLTTKQRRVVEVVAQVGGPPTPKFARPFWTRVAKRLKFDDPITVAKLFYRATRKAPHLVHRKGRK